jgi:hypothetical protein
MHLRDRLSRKRATGRPAGRQNSWLRKELAAQSRPAVVSRLPGAALYLDGIGTLFYPARPERRQAPSGAGPLVSYR